MQQAISGRLRRLRYSTAIYRVPVVFIVLRTVLGFTPPEWAYVTTQRGGVEVTQGAIRALDRKIRMGPLTPLRLRGASRTRDYAPLSARPASFLVEGSPNVPSDILHRLDKADTKLGLASIQPLTDLGVPYAMVL